VASIPTWLLERPYSRGILVALPVGAVLAIVMAVYTAGDGVGQSELCGPHEGIRVRIPVTQYSSVQYSSVEIREFR